MPDDDKYRRAIQGRVEELLSKRHDISTSRLLIEAMTEGMSLYRSYKEQEREEEMEKKRYRRHRSAGHRDGNEKTGHRQRCNHIHIKVTDGSNDGHRHQHRDQSCDRGHRRHRHGSHGKRVRSSQDKYNVSSLKGRHYRSGSRDGHSNYYPRAGTDNVHDLTAASKEENNLMSGASGHRILGENLIPESSPHSMPDQVNDSNSRRTTPTCNRLTISRPKTQLEEQPQSHKRKSHPGLEDKRDSVAHNARQRGEGEDPLSRYQSRAHQRHSDTRAGRTGTCRLPMQQQRGPEGTPFGGLPKYKYKAGMALGLYNHFVSTYKHIKAEQDAGYRAKGFIEKALEGARKRRPDAKMGTDKHGRDRRTPKQYPQGEHDDHYNDENRTMDFQPRPSRSLHWDDISNSLTQQPRSPAEPEMTSEMLPPTMAHALSPPSLLGRDVDGARAALLDSIQGGVRLRRVASLDKKDLSASPSAGKVVYEATEHSGKVEERERAQAAEAAQGVEGETELGPEPNRAF